jgi:hypothetical protein
MDPVEVPQVEGLVPVAVPRDGAEGALRVKGPRFAVEQPVAVICRLVYVPGARLLIVSVPADEILPVPLTELPLKR